MTTLESIKNASGVGFGTSGARGLVTALSEEVCFGYTYAFIKTMQAQYAFKAMAIAIDLRPSSLQIAAFCAKAAASLNIEVIFCGEVPTPALALYCLEKKIPGIMVTGSHIPFDRNGLKFYRPDGEISKADEQAMLATTIAETQAPAVSLPAIYHEAREAYIKRYLRLLPEGAFAGKRIGVYQHSSVARDLIVEILEQLGATVIAIGRSDQFVPIDTEAVSAEDVAKGLAWATSLQTDCIVSTDGDADRPLISDEHGNWLRGDIVGLLTAKGLGVPQIAIPVSCNSAIEKSRYFERVSRCRIGSPYVIAEMAVLAEASPAPVAGFEANGGFLLGSDVMVNSTSLKALPTRDAVLPVIVILATAIQQGEAISALVETLPQRFTMSDRLQNLTFDKLGQFVTDWSANVHQHLLQLTGHTVVAVDLTDGVRATLDNAEVVHIRASGNAPELRCYVEADAIAKAEQLLNVVLTYCAKLLQA